MSNSEIVLLEASQIQLASEILGNSFKNDAVFQYFEVVETINSYPENICIWVVARESQKR